MTFQEALKHLDAGNFSPVYLITGDEPFLIEALLRHFLKQGLEASACGFNFNPFRAGETSPEIMLSIANTFPILSPRRMVWVQNADLLKDDRGLFLNYLDNPAETTLLVFIAEKPDLRKKLFSVLKKKAALIECPRLKEREIPAWIRQAAKKAGLTLSEEVIWFLKEHLGSDLLAIHQEIEKLALFCVGEGGVASEAISVASAQKIIGNGRAHSIFELTHAVGNKDCKTALVLLEKMLSEGAHSLFILTMLVRLWRQMAVARALIDSGQAGAVASRVPMPPGLLQAFLQQVRCWSREEIETAFERALSADSQLKGGGLSEKVVMQTLLMDLCLNRSTFRGGSGYSLSFLSPRRP